MQRSATETSEKNHQDKEPKVEMTIRDAGGELIRTQRFPVHQGINRIVWDMRRDGVRPMPGPEPAELEDGLPAGPEVLPGDYEVTLSLAVGASDAVTSSHSLSVLADPRSPFDSSAYAANYQARLELMKMQERAVSAVERIVHAQSGVSTALALIDQQLKPGADPDEAVKALKESAEEIQESLAKLEKRFRTPPRTKGIVYDDDKVANRIGMAMYYVGSTRDAPTPTARVYVEQARQDLDAATAAVDLFMAGELEAFRQALSDAGIGLFASSIGN
jgi:hypothetical protein